jgi:nitroimidazol reductase NimA-like FMN-containing flavoprotein (pyridoxamine 5'-phosphate oxidase superfamily)
MNAKASRPFAPDYGIRKDSKGLLSWHWAEKHLSKSRQYFLTTVNVNSRPHTMPIWGVWMNQSFWFSTGRKSQKARNLSHNNNCTVCTEKSEEAIILEGRVFETKNASQKTILRKFDKAYKKKYGIISPSGEPIYQVRPIRVFGFVEKTFPKTATRWLFSDILKQ